MVRKGVRGGSHATGFVFYNYRSLGGSPATGSGSKKAGRRQEAGVAKWERRSLALVSPLRRACVK